MFHLRLQQLQWIGGLVVALCCLVLGGMSFLAALDDYRRVRAGIEDFDRFRKVLAVLSAISAERGPANLAMTLPASHGGARDWLRAARTTSDSSLDAAMAALLSVSSEMGEAVDQLATVRTKLRDARAVVDAVIAPDPERRPPRAVSDAIRSMFSVSDAAERARSTVGRHVIRSTPEISTEVFLGLAASGLREHAGRFGSYVVMQLVPNGAERDGAFEQMFVTAGRLASLRGGVEASMSSMQEEGPVRAALARLNERLFGETIPRAAAVARKARAGEPISVQSFTDLYVADLRYADELRDSLAAASIAKLDGIRRDSLKRLVMSGALTLLVCLILFATILVFRRSLFDPLTTARLQLQALASGDLTEPKLDGPVGPEVGEMLADLNSLRDEQRVQRELEDDRRRATDELRELARTDVLTGLVNRRFLEGEARRALLAADATSRAVALVMFDIDHFKRINDTHGHGVGDLVLRRIANDLGPLVRPDAIFARYGGEEFLVLLPDVVRGEAEAVAARLRATIETIAFPEAPMLTATASFGVAVRAAGAAASWDSMLAVADRRLYAAKRAGRNRICSADNSRGWVSAAA